MTDHPEEHLVRLRGLNAVYQALSAVELPVFSLPSLLQIVLETGAKLTNAKYGALGVFDESGAKLTEFITVGLDAETKKRIGTSPMGFGLLGVMNEEPGVLRLKDLSRHPKSVGFPPHHPSMKSFLGISIRAHGRIFGRLYLTEKQGAEEFSEVDAEIVTALASQAGTILERGLLIEQLKSAETKHRLILESAAESIYGLDLDGVCTFINKAGSALLGYRPEELVGRRMHSLVHHTRPDGLPYPEEECPTERSRRHGRPSHLIEDIYWRKDGTSFPVQLSCAPILSEGALRGAVVTFFDITERKDVERRKALDHGITLAVAASETSDETNQKILQTVCEVLGWEWSAVWEVDSQAKVLRCLTTWHQPNIAVPEFEAITHKITFAPGVGLPGRVWSTGKTTHIPDVTRDPNFPRAAVAARAGLRSGFAFPIRLGGAIVGVMEFFSREFRKPSQDMLNTLVSLGTQIGLQVERKRAEEAIRTSGARLQQVLDTLPAAAYTCDAEGLITYFNESARALWGRSPKLNDLMDRFGGSLKLFRTDGTPIRLDECWMAVALRERRVVDGKEIVIERPDGSRRSTLAHATPMFDPSGQLTGAVNVLVDITDRKQAEEEIERAHTFLDSIVENIPNMIFVKDTTDLKFVRFNKAGEELLGYTRHELIGKSDYDFFPTQEADFFTSNDRAVLDSRQLLDIPEEPIETKNLGTRILHTKKIPILDKEGRPQYLLGISEDITERKRAEKTLREILRRLQQAQEEERKQIAREIHDELGQQLTMLRFGLVKLAQAEQQPPAELRNQARALTQPVDTMIDTVRRIATSLRPAILDDLGLAAALEWLVTDFRSKSNLPCDASLASLPGELDDTRSMTLFRILQEALTNIARHAQATRVTVRLQQVDDTLILEIHDNGRGLTEAQRTSPAAIGLFGMQERALLVGGAATIESRPKEGTTVTARIPIR